MLKQIKLMVFMVFNIHCELNLIESNEIKLSDLEPKIKMSDFVEKPVYLKEMIQRGYQAAYMMSHGAFYLLHICNLKWDEMDSKNESHVLFGGIMMIHVCVSLLPFFITYFKFRTIFAIVNNGVVLWSFLLEKQLPLRSSGLFYISALVTHLVMNIILFTHNRKTIIINIKDLVEELQIKEQEGNNLQSLI